MVFFSIDKHTIAGTSFEENLRSGRFAAPDSGERILADGAQRVAAAENDVSAHGTSGGEMGHGMFGIYWDAP